MIQLCVVGFQKCGQHSAIVHLQEQGFEVKKYEIAYQPNAVELLHKKYPNHRPVFICRNRADMIWSTYHYFQYNNEMSFEDYLEIDRYDKQKGVQNPIERADYNKWIKPFAHEELNPLVLNFDSLIENERFPNLNKGGKYPEMSLRFRGLVNNILNSRKIEIRVC